MSAAEFSQVNQFVKPKEVVPEPLAGVIARAVNEMATDVHIDAWGEQAALRFRVDGMIHPSELISYDESRRLINQVKVSARMDLATVLAPQEGHFRWYSLDRCRDIRATVVATAPMHEAAHLRLLTPPEEWLDIKNLGLGSREIDTVESTLRKPHGLVLIAGPTGAGKTTTLYSLTGLTDLREKIAASIEDPAEFDLPYVRQLEIKEHRGFTMEEGLKTILRIDADIVLVGEIRDSASAKIAARAALAGRLVLATIHARDITMAIETMRYLSVPDHVLGAALRLVIAQDLVRKLCPNCARPRPLAPHEREMFQAANVMVPENVHDPVGCDRCFHHGYRGRTGVFQVAAIDAELGRWLAAGQPDQSLRERLVAPGGPLVRDALKKAAAGVTSMQEVVILDDKRLDRSAVDSSTTFK